MAKLIGKECKFVTHLRAIPNVREDTHVIKEILHYEDGTLKDNLKIVKNFKRPFYVVKEHLRKYKDKKESEELDRLNKYYSTESDLGRNIASRLGQQYVGITSVKDVRDSPYVYGIDVNSSTIIKKMYMDKYPDITSKYKLATLDIESDVVREEITICTLAMEDKIYTVFTEEYLKNSNVVNNKVIERLDSLYKNYIPDGEIKQKAKIEFKIVKNEYELIKEIFAKAHKWHPDFVAIWNIDYDIPYMVRVIEKYGGDPADIFSDPSLPKELRYFQYKQGMKQKITESGVYKPVNPEEQWHVVKTPAMFYLIDAMSAHRYVRVGGKTIPGGYSLDNILTKELGKKFKKLKFGEEDRYKGVEWHMYMSEKMPLEYIIYNMWDCMSMLELDKKTKDLEVVLPMLSGASSFDIFNSGPKKIVDGMYFFYQEYNKILGVKPNKVNADSILGLGEWIVLLPSHRIKNNGLQAVQESSTTRLNTRAYVYDSDERYKLNTKVI